MGHNTDGDYSFDIEGYVDFGNGVRHGYSNGAGHGILDVYAALQPIVSSDYKNSVYSASSSNLGGTRFELAESSIKSSTTFGDALSANLVGVENKFFDAMGGGFAYGMSQNVLTQKIGHANISFSDEFSSFATNDNHRKDKSILKDRFDGAMIDRSNENQKHRLVATFDKPLPSTQLIFDAPTNQLNDFSTFGSDFLSANDGGVGITYIAKQNRARYFIGFSRPTSAFDGEKIVQYGKQADLALGMQGNLGLRSEIGVIFGRANDTNNLLGMEGTGAYNLEGSNTSTNYLNLNLSSEFKINAAFDGSLIVGRSNMSKPSNIIIAGAKDVTSTSFRAGLSVKDLLWSDNMRFQVTQPPRIEGGELNFDITESYDSLGNILHKRESVDLTPTGRQINYSMRYSSTLNNETKIKLSSTLVSQPDHDKSAQSLMTTFAGIERNSHRFGLGMKKQRSWDLHRYAYQWRPLNSDNADLIFSVDVEPEIDNSSARVSYRLHF